MEFKDGGDVMAGDQILVMPKVDSKMMQSIKDITRSSIRLPWRPTWS